jgi:DNA-binding NtrC family response regulator
VPLAHHFFDQFAAQPGRALSGIAPEALAALRAYDWPGNVRELRNVVERAVALTRGPVIRLRDLPESVRAPRPRFTKLPPVNGAAAGPLPGTKASAHEEADRIRQALHKHHNNRARAAAELGISRVAFYKKLHKFGLFAGRSRPSDVEVPNPQT